MQSLLVISALGQDRPGIVEKLSAATEDTGCNIMDSRMAVLGGEFALIMLISGNWDGIAKLEAQLPRLGEQLELQINSRRTEERAHSTNELSYTVEVVAMDHPGIVHDITAFFASRRINIEDFYTGSYHAPHTGTPMFALNMTISVPGDLSIARLRGEFLDMCDNLNLDAVMGPAK